MDRKSFLFYRDWADALEGCEDSVRLEVFDALLHYAFKGEVGNLSATAKMAFSFIKPAIDRDMTKYNDICERNRENIRKRWNTKNTTGTTGKSGIRTNTKNTDNDNDIDNDINKKTSTNVDVKKADASASAIQEREKEFYQELVPFVEKYGSAMVRQFYDYWREPNKSGTKMRFEQQPTWKLELRLARWANGSKFEPKNNNTTVLHDNTADKYDTEEEKELLRRFNNERD